MLTRSNRVIRPLADIEMKIQKIEEERDSLLAAPGITDKRQARLSLLGQRLLALKWVVYEGWLV